MIEFVPPDLFLGIGTTYGLYSEMTTTSLQVKSSDLFNCFFKSFVILLQNWILTVLRLMLLPQSYIKWTSKNKLRLHKKNKGRSLGDYEQKSKIFLLSAACTKHLNVQYTTTT